MFEEIITNFPILHDTWEVDDLLISRKPINQNLEL